LIKHVGLLEEIEIAEQDSYIYIYKNSLLIREYFMILGAP